MPFRRRRYAGADIAWAVAANEQRAATRAETANATRRRRGMERPSSQRRAGDTPAWGIDSVDDLDPERDGEERGVFEHVAPRHSHPTERFGTPKPAEVAAAHLDPLQLHAVEGRLPDAAVLEEHVREGGAAEVALAHPAVPEHDALAPRHAQPG